MENKTAIYLSCEACGVEYPDPGPAPEQCPYCDAWREPKAAPREAPLTPDEWRRLIRMVEHVPEETAHNWPPGVAELRTLAAKLHAARDAALAEEMERG